MSSRVVLWVDYDIEYVFIWKINLQELGILIYYIQDLEGILAIVIQEVAQMN